jgi:hypothetical protein
VKVDVTSTGLPVRNDFVDSAAGLDHVGGLCPAGALRAVFGHRIGDLGDGAPPVHPAKSRPQQRHRKCGQVLAAVKCPCALTA